MLLEAKRASRGSAGNILVMSSMAGTIPSPSIGVHSMTKAALDNMVKMLS